MENIRLEKRSECFMDERGEQVDKRCWFLLVGEDDHNSNAITIALSVNIFDEPRVQMMPLF